MFIEKPIKSCEKEREIASPRTTNVYGQTVQEVKAGYLEEWRYHGTYSGTPQGGIISPILANIYLNELDKKIAQISETFKKPREREYTVSEEKKLITHSNRKARFLGYDIRVRRCNQLKIGGCGKSRKMAKRTLNYMTGLTRLCRINRP